MSPGGTAYTALSFWLGNDYFHNNGELDRKKLRDLVFNDTTRLRKLEAIVHPLVSQEFSSRLKALPQSIPYAILEIPLLTEKHKANLVDRVLVIDCSEETQIERSSNRDQTNAADIKKIIKQQMSRSERLALADDVINNDGSPAQLKTKIEAQHQVYLGLSETNH